MAEWCGLYAESSKEDFLKGEKLCKGDTIYLLGVEGEVCFECGAVEPRCTWEEVEDADY